MRSTTLFGGLLVSCVWLHATTTTTLLTVVPTAPSFGQAVTLTATVSPAPQYGPGMVSFMDGGVLVGIGTLNSSGVAQLTTLTLTAGVHSLRAVFAGVSHFGVGGVGGGIWSPSQSAAQSYTVTAVPGVGFAQPAGFATGFNNASAAMGDFNGDGKVDLAVANHAFQRLCERAARERRWDLSAGRKLPARILPLFRRCGRLQR